jgi:hypothetical protein
MSTVFCYIDSNDRVAGTPGNFTIQLPEPVQLFQESKLRVDQIRLINSFLTVSSANDHFYWFDSTPTLHSATLSHGWFSAINLASNIKASLPGSFSVTYNSALNSLTISNPADFTLPTDDDLATWSAPWPFAGTSPSNLRSCNGLLNNPGGTATNKSYTIPFVTVSPYDFVFLRSQRLASQMCISARGEHDVLARIDVNQPFGGLLTGGTPLMESLVIGQGTIHTLDFQLTDRLGNIINQVQGSLTFQLTFFP